MRKLSCLFVFLAVVGLTASALADVRLPKAFTDNAVLQRDVPVNVWGWADAGEEVTVSFNGSTANAIACEGGKWSVKLPAMAAFCDGKELVVKGKNEIRLQNVVVGEVWICSGQSNMEMPLNSWGQPRLACSDEEIQGDYSFIRFNRARHELGNKPAEDVPSDGWKLCKDGVQASCTACGFHFANRIYKELGVPVGLIDVNWGGSNIHSWIPDEGWANVAQIADFGKTLIVQREADVAKDGKTQYRHAGSMYYAMLAPWRGYTLRGALWYQGCSNGGEGETYYFKQKAMIQEWRKLWGQGDFPFYWVQLASFTAPSDNPNERTGWGTLRDAQTQCLEVANTGQAVTIDIGEEKDIHPRNKFDVGNRLARWALAKVYGKNVACASPIFKSVEYKDGKSRVTFDNVGGGLVCGRNVERQPLVVEKDGVLNRFAVAGDDGKFFWADAKIVGKDTVELSCKDVPAPKAVRYAWQQNPVGCNLYSAEGLPATPFSK
ncbi:MAG: sialate O-acetylesterase [Planctomycetia bacterium]|nr:sialate O-acetylesterase [Planctomycetia bacterium]